MGNGAEMKNLLAVLILTGACFAQTAKLSKPQDYEDAANDWQTQSSSLEDDINTTMRSANACPGGQARPDDPAHCWTMKQKFTYMTAARARESALIGQMQAKYGKQFSSPQDLRKKNKQ